MLGGMMAPTVEAEALIAAAVCGRYPARFMARISTAPVPAASATAEPAMPAKMRLDRMLACA
jgi:hypothetical protein